MKLVTLVYLKLSPPFTFFRIMWALSSHHPPSCRDRLMSICMHSCHLQPISVIISLSSLFSKCVCEPPSILALAPPLKLLTHYLSVSSPLQCSVECNSTACAPPTLISPFSPTSTLALPPSTVVIMLWALNSPILSLEAHQSYTQIKQTTSLLPLCRDQDNNGLFHSTCDFITKRSISSLNLQ